MSDLTGPTESAGGGRVEESERSPARTLRCGDETDGRGVHLWSGSARHGEPCACGKARLADEAKPMVILQIDDMRALAANEMIDCGARVHADANSRHLLQTAFAAPAPLPEVEGAAPTEIEKAWWGYDDIYGLMSMFPTLDEWRAELDVERAKVERAVRAPLEARLAALEAEKISWPARARMELGDELAAAEARLADAHAKAESYEAVLESIAEECPGEPVGLLAQQAINTAARYRAAPPSPAAPGEETKE